MQAVLIPRLRSGRGVAVRHAHGGAGDAGLGGERGRRATTGDGVGGTGSGERAASAGGRRTNRYTGCRINKCGLG
eukprot:scaffold9936_cov130-Isochrysis_galbana.AAC.7